MRDCSTGKICHMSKEVAEEALIDNRARFHHGLNSGPINVYHCSSCDCYHFTSKGEVHPMLLKDSTKERIDKLKKGWDWEDKFRS